MLPESGAIAAGGERSEVVQMELRQLRAIMFTDMLGFSALSQANEALALRLLEEHNQTLRVVFPKHGGREIKSLGDGFLVVFPSALAAVQCAIEIQRTLYIRNMSADPNETVLLRIGVHVGDVVHRGGDVYGDGVNIASRLQSMADVGGVCISGQVFDQVRNKLTEPIIPLGRGELKNIKLPVELFRVLMPWERRRSRSAIALPAGLRVPDLPLRQWGVIAVATLAIGIAWFWPRPAKAMDVTPNAPAVVSPAPVVAAPSASPSHESVAVAPEASAPASGITVQVIPDSAKGSFRVVTEFNGTGEHSPVVMVRVQEPKKPTSPKAPGATK